VTVKGIYKMIPVKYYNAIYRICQEAVTNTIKHSQAENIYIIIRNDDKKIDINIFDDGIGCNSLKRGNGLSGMEQRVRELSGSIKFTSVENEGFYIKANMEILTESNKNIT
jgi:signal transduction histidine kinase